MQENRSFDSYFGTFPGANGIPQGTCVPLDPSTPNAGCVVPFHDPHDRNAGGPHRYSDALADLDNGMTQALMDGFLLQQTTGGTGCDSGASGHSHAPGVVCARLRDGTNRHDAVGYHTAAEIPNYWAYALKFVLQDNLFEGDRGWSPDAHLELTSEWTAKCTEPTMLSTCTSTHEPAIASAKHALVYPWVNLFQLMDLNGVSWKYYLANGTEPDCEDGGMTCAPVDQKGSVLSFWNPVPGFAWVRQQPTGYLAAHNPDLDQFLLDVQQGNLPQVSYVVPTNALSEHPPNGVTAGMEYVTSLVNAVMQSPYWSNTAILIAWDDWGGFYDHVVPPIVDFNSDQSQVQGYGLRVPGIMISAYARAGMIDHAQLSFDNYAMLIEQLFMGGVHLDPVAMGQPDNRPTVRDAVTSVNNMDGSTSTVGNLLDEFDFTQAPLPPLILSTHIPSDIAAACDGTKDASEACRTSKVKLSWSAAGVGSFTYTVYRDGQQVCRTTALVCTDNAPGSGSHFYTATSTDAGGVISPASAAAEADVP